MTSKYQIGPSNVHHFPIKPALGKPADGGETTTKNQIQLSRKINPGWTVERLFGKRHWVSEWVIGLCESEPRFLLHLIDQSPDYVHFVCLVRLALLKYSADDESLKYATWMLTQNKKSILQSLYPSHPDGLLVRCEVALAMSKELVKTWLEAYMFKAEEDGPQKVEAISNWFAEHQNFKSHSRHISRDDLEDQGLVITRLENDEKLQDASLSVFHATTHTFTGTPAVKIVENQTGRAFIRHHAHPQMPPGFQIDLMPNQPPV